jgi:predicted alpha/beta-hydrolase family hydrolase
LTPRDRPASGDGRLMFAAEALSLPAIASQLTSVEDAVARWSCGAMARQRRAGGTPSCLDGTKSRAWVDVCSDRLRMQEALL